MNAFTIDAATHSSLDGSGTIGWHYNIDDGALDFLGADDVVTLTYTVQVDDGHGGIKTQDVTITVHGTEDKPVITTATSDSFAEQTGTNNPGNDTVSGTISFTDVDLSDRPTVSAPFDHYTYTAADHVTALTLTPTQEIALEQALLITPAANTNNGSASWSYTVADNKFDFLAAGEILTLTYTATVNDGNGGVISQPITVTITGTNDTPVAVVISQNANEDGPAVTLTANFSDPDINDTHTFTANATSAHGATIVNNGNGTFTYDPSTITGIESAPFGTPIADSFTYTVTDNHGASSSAFASITINVPAETVTATAVDGGTVIEGSATTTTTISVVGAASADADDSISSYAATSDDQRQWCDDHRPWQRHLQLRPEHDHRDRDDGGAGFLSTPSPTRRPTTTATPRRRR